MLPPVPPTVMRLTQTILVGGNPMTTSWWLQNPSFDRMDGPHAEAFFAAYFSTVQPNLLALMHSEAACTTCRFAVAGFVAESNSPPNLGEWTGATECAVASGLKWTTRERGRRAWSISYVPACPSAFVSNHWQLNATGYSTLRAQGLLLLQNFNQLLGPDGSFCELGTLQRKRAGAPLSVAQFVGYQDVYPIEKLVTCARRIPPSGVLLPL